MAAHQSAGGREDGGVGVGNVNLEAIQFPGQTEQQHTIAWLPFEPRSLDESLRELTRRGLAARDCRNQAKRVQGRILDECDAATVL
jgi:hypothetical protein